MQMEKDTVNERVRNFRRWCRAMQSGPHSSITLCNIAHDIRGDKPRASKKDVKAIMRRALDAWLSIDGEDGGKAADVLARALNSAAVEVFCKGPEIENVPENVSRIVDWEALKEHYFLNSADADLIRPHIDKPERVDEKISLTGARLNPNAKVRGERPHAWITASAVIDALRAEFPAETDRARLARRVRDFLGLDHYTKQELFEMIYPENALEGKRVASPTFIEGACRPVYRSGGDADPWGHTVDMSSENFEDGAPEAVHESIPFTAEFSLSYLGTVRDASETSDHERLHERLRAWQEADMLVLEKIIFDE